MLCRWNGASPQSAEEQAKPDVRKADDAVNSAEDQLHKKGAAAAPDNTLSNGPSTENRAGSKTVDPTRHNNPAVNPELQLNQTGPESLQQRTQAKLRQH